MHHHTTTAQPQTRNPPPCYLNDLGLFDLWALYQLARPAAFFYAYIKENRQPVWLGVTRFMTLALRLRLRRPRHWFKAIRHGETHALLGCVVLLDIGMLSPYSGEVAYFTALPARNQGITSHAVFSVVHWAKQNLGLRGLYASVDPDNPASMTILTRLGLSPLRFVPAEHSVFHDRVGNPRACWVMQTTPQSFNHALANHSANPYPVLSGQKRPDAQHGTIS